MNNSYFNIFTSISEASMLVKVVLLILLLLSIYSWGIIINKIRLINKHISLLKKLRKIVKKDKSNFSDLINGFSKFKYNPYTTILKFLMSNKDILIVKNSVNQVILDTVYNYLYDVNFKLENRLSSLATVGTISPFIGLFGTIVGIINSFFAISANSSASLAVIAPGIAEALYATAIGLFVAIPAVFAYNIFSNKIDNYKEQQNILLHEIIINFIKDNSHNTYETTNPLQENSIKKSSIDLVKYK